MDVIYVLGQLDILGIDMCPQATAGRLRSIVQMGFIIPIGVGRQVGNSQTFVACLVV